MPELPEVETVKKVLVSQLKGRKITNISSDYHEMVEQDFNCFYNNLLNEEFLDIKRMGKYLIFQMTNNYLIAHLRMEGKFFYVKTNSMMNKHIHMIFELDNGYSLLYQDTRKFGRMIVKNESELFSTKPLNKLALDANDPTFTKETLHIRLKGRKIPIKEALLNQEIIAGLGNIYVDEVLFASRISPLREACDVSCTECGIILEESRKILNKAISYKGTTIRSYTSSLGVIGEFQNFLCVHTKEICPICKGEITKTRISGRGTYYCARCQK